MRGLQTVRSYCLSESPQATHNLSCSRGVFSQMRLAILCTVPVVSSCGGPVLSRMWCHPLQSLPIYCPSVSILSQPGLSQNLKIAALSEKARNTAVSSSPLVPTLPPGSRCKGTAVGVAVGPVGRRARPRRWRIRAREPSKWQDCKVSKDLGKKQSHSLDH